MIKTILIILAFLVALGGVIWVVKKIFKDPDDNEWRGWR